MSGAEDFGYVWRQFEGDKLAAWMGIELMEVKEGEAAARLVVREEHLNSLNGVHGGTLMTLGDFAAAVASYTRGQKTILMNCHTSFFRPCDVGTELTAVAREVSCGRRTGTYIAEIRDGEGRLIAQFQGTLFRSEEKVGGA